LAYVQGSNEGSSVLVDFNVESFPLFITNNLLTFYTLGNPYKL